MKYLALIITLMLIPKVQFGQELKLEYEPEKISQKIRAITNEIEKENEIHSDAVGYRGEKTSQYKRFEKLTRKAKIDELVELTEHPSPVVRGYAFWALAKRNYKKLEEIFIKHLRDEEKLKLYEGCIGLNTSVINFLYQVVSPNLLDWRCKTFDEETFERIEKIKNEKMN
ncbi:MAG: hypothetical protein H6577_10670 [Lewinellaceae bacterium]|nr:hypothetical protein [Lewinellaceae bacterium]